MTGSFWEYFLFYGLVGFYITWLEGVCHLVQELYFTSSPGDLATVFTYLVTPTAVLKLIFFILISADEKNCYFRSRVLANHSASFSFLHPVRRFLQTTICPCTPSLSILSQSANICWLSFWLWFVTSATRNWPTFLIPLLTVSLWQPVNSNTEG